MAEYRDSLNDPNVNTSIVYDDIIQDFCYTFNMLACRFDNLDIEHISPETFDYGTVSNILTVIGAYIIVPRVNDNESMSSDLGFYSPVYTYHLYTRACELLSML
jgi:hypothetical protein